MKVSDTILLLLSAGLVSAHFELVYPYWRGNSFLPPASQYLFPCKSGRSCTLYRLLCIHIHEDENLTDGAPTTVGARDRRKHQHDRRL